ncbi:ABC transporter permease [Persicirhabdus sediminis]|uniref:ABC transporter permease n=1 Tax=Persicirhabdus sediminis TaxID=454144 RepID=UPI002D7FB3C0|nr:FtsX-like permease family protein [Persicirhabdus sediminis]
MITLISLLGVGLGVMVLVVVMSVFGGFEKMVYERVLSHTAHVEVRMTNWAAVPDDPDAEISPVVAEWRGMQKRLESLPGVTSTYAIVQDYAIIEDAYTRAIPLQVQAIDTDDDVQLAALAEVIEAGDANMGVGDVAVISSLVAKNLDLQVGDSIQALSSRNLKKVKPILERLDAPPAAESFQPEIEFIKTSLNKAKVVDGELEIYQLNDLIPINGTAQMLADNPLLREQEKQVVNDFLDLLYRGDRDSDEDPERRFPAGATAEMVTTLDQLADVDIDQATLDEIKSSTDFILPKDLEVIGIYTDTPHAPGPPLIIPLPVGQSLFGMGDMVQGIGVRMENPALAEQFAREVVDPAIADSMWVASSWMQRYQQQFGLIKMQRIMLSFALFFIVMVSAFSISAVMFTVTIQKKREIGVMKALGATPFQLVKVFLYQGLIIGFIGTLLGVISGLLVIWNRKPIQGLMEKVGFDPFPADFNGFTDGLPAEINSIEIVVISVIAFLMCVVATIFPVIGAARSDAARSLRNQ